MLVFQVGNSVLAITTNILTLLGFMVACVALNGSFKTLIPWLVILYTVWQHLVLF